MPEAQYNLALAYELGRGVGKDEVAAQKWYRAAATQGYARARYNLALMLEEGRPAPADAAAAVEFYRAAAAQNYAPAQNNLGILLAEGRGVAINFPEAYAWLALAVDNGAKPTGRDIVAQQLSSAQLAEANITIAKLRAQIGVPEAPPARAESPDRVAAAAAPSTSSADLAALNSRILDAQSELEKFRAENARLTATAQSLAREKLALEQRLSSVAAAVPPTAKPDDAREKLAQQLSGLQTALSEARDNAGQLAAENKRLRSLPTVADATKLETARASELAAANSRLAAASADLEKTRSENARLAAAASAAQAEKSGLDQRLAESARAF
ncbi:MAG: hypothetical protein EXS32_14460 [Opitutus sp.]|nr:hypothetical protein [Opitutus sp.]